MKLAQSQIDSIDETINLGSGMKVVRLDYSGQNHLTEDEHNFNVFCVGADGSILWKISSDLPEKRDSFVSIDFEDGTLTADRFFGGEYEVDMNTGVATKVGWHK